jgi:hypothetical protein
MANIVRAPGKVLLRRFFGRALLYVLSVAAVAYAADYAILRYRIATNRSPYSTVTVHPYDVVPRKDHKVEFLPEDPHDETCTNSLFPQMGHPPCWYLKRHTEQAIEF